jgi:glycerol uptake facilitator-like aquaporin
MTHAAKQARPVVAEFLGSAMLLAIIVGSGIMGERLAAGNVAVALLANTIATGAGLVVLIQMFGPVSGAHFNPAVTMAALLKRETTMRVAILYMIAQLVGAVIGVWIAHAMFAEPILQISSKARDGWPQGLAECVATFGLIGTILATRRNRPEVTPMAVGLYITAAYWFTASTSFANPAVTIARSLSNSFAGIAPHSVPLFIPGQLLGTVAAIMLFDWLLKEEIPA